MITDQKKYFERLKEESIKKIFEEEEILFAYLFGSRARGDERENSDLDIAFYPSENYDEKNFLKLWGKLSDKITGVEIQIVNLKTAGNQILTHSVFTEGKLIYEKSVNERIEKETPLVMICKERMWRHHKNLIKKYVKGEHFTLKD